MPSALRNRPAEPADRGLLLQVYAGTRAAELAATGWPPALCEAFLRQQFDAQARHHAVRWPQSEQAIVQLAQGAGAAAERAERAEGAEAALAWIDIGRLWIDRHGPGWHVIDIALLPAWRGQGLGGRCLRGLQQQAARAGQPLSLQVALDNPARRLYARLGFRADGPVQGIHQRMVWSAPGAGSGHRTQEHCDEQA